MTLQSKVPHQNISFCTSHPEYFTQEDVLNIITLPSYAATLLFRWWGETLHISTASGSWWQSICSEDTNGPWVVVHLHFSSTSMSRVGIQVHCDTRQLGTSSITCTNTHIATLGWHRRWVDWRLGKPASSFTNNSKLLRSHVDKLLRSHVDRLLRSRVDRLLRSRVDRLLRSRVDQLLSSHLDNPAIYLVDSPVANPILIITICFQLLHIIFGIWITYLEKSMRIDWNGLAR